MAVPASTPSSGSGLEAHYILASKDVAGDDVDKKRWITRVSEADFRRCKDRIAATVPARAARIACFKEVVVRNMHYRVDASYKAHVTRRVALDFDGDWRGGAGGVVKVVFDVQKMPYSAFPCTKTPDSESYVELTSVRLGSGRTAVNFEKRVYQDEDEDASPCFRIFVVKKGAASEADGEADVEQILASLLSLAGGRERAMPL